MNDLMLHRGLIMTQPVIDGGYINCEYDVKTTSAPTKLLGFNVGLMSMIRSMKIDEVDEIITQPVSEYTFKTTGSHSIQFCINYVFSALNMFNGCKDLVSITFDTNTDINLNMSDMASSCTNLQEVVFKKDMKIKKLEQSFYNCKALGTIDLTEIHLTNPGSNKLYYTFYNASAKKIVLGDFGTVYLLGTFFALKDNETTIDLKRMPQITGYSQPFTSADQPKLLDFGKCDLSLCRITSNCFFDFGTSNPDAQTIMLGKPMLYPNTISILDKMKGEFIFNPAYDFSPIFYENPLLTPKAITDEPVNKIFKIRFCTNDAWVIDESLDFFINGVRGVYTSRGIWEFSINDVKDYKYQILHNGKIIGEAVVKNDEDDEEKSVQQIAFGDNTVYKVLDFSLKNQIDDSIITNIEGYEWGWPEDMLELSDLTENDPYWNNQDTEYFRKGYLGYTHKRVGTNASTSVIINTGMKGDVIITTALNSQTHYYYGILHNSDDKQLIAMNGNLYQSYETKFKVNTSDGIIKFTYSKIFTRDNPPAANGLDRMFIKKIEHYNWPEIPE